MDWKELGEKVWTLWTSIHQQFAVTKKASEKLAPAQATLVRVYLAELLKHKEDPALSAVDDDFPSEMTIGGAKSLLDLMYAYWRDEFEVPVVATFDPLDT